MLYTSIWAKQSCLIMRIPHGCGVYRSPSTFKSCNITMIIHFIFTVFGMELAHIPHLSSLMFVYYDYHLTFMVSCSLPKYNVYIQLLLRPCSTTYLIRIVCIIMIKVVLIISKACIVNQTLIHGWRYFHVILESTQCTPGFVNFYNTAKVELALKVWIICVWIRWCEQWQWLNNNLCLNWWIKMRTHTALYRVKRCLLVGWDLQVETLIPVVLINSCYIS